MTFKPDRFISNVQPPQAGGMAGFLRKYETHHKSEARPLLWTFTTADQDDNFLTHVWLNNGTAETLKRVTIGTSTFTTVDEASFSASKCPTTYDDVLPNEAVRIDTRHDVYDSDYVVSTELLIERAGQKPLALRTKAGKGGSAGEVLLREC